MNRFYTGPLRSRGVSSEVIYAPLAAQVACEHGTHDVRTLFKPDTEQHANDRNLIKILAICSPYTKCLNTSTFTRLSNRTVIGVLNNL